MSPIIRKLFKWVGILLRIAFLVVLITIVALIAYEPGQNKEHIVGVAESPDGQK